MRSEEEGKKVRVKEKEERMDCLTDGGMDYITQNATPTPLQLQWNLNVVG